MDEHRSCEAVSGARVGGYFATVVLVGYPLVGFSAVISTPIQVNGYIHFLGYALGFLTVYVSLIVD